MCESGSEGVSRRVDKRVGGLAGWYLTDRQTDMWTGGQASGIGKQMIWRSQGRAYGQANWQANGWALEQSCSWMDSWTGRQVDGWIGRRADGWTHRRSNDVSAEDRTNIVGIREYIRAGVDRVGRSRSGGQARGRMPGG